MLIANALLRHLMIDDKEFFYKSKEQFSAYSMYMRMSLPVVMQDQKKKEIYMNILNHIQDNAYPEQKIDGNVVRAQQAFSIHNIAKMALASQSIIPGNWYGVGQIAHILKKCNRLFRPMCDDFQVIV